MVSETKHSPGPWVITRRALGDGDRVRVYSPGSFVAVVGGESDLSCKIEANARLIAAAPDLLAACEAVISAGESENLPTTVYNAVEAAIAKANGESV